MDKVAIVATAPNCEAGQGGRHFFLSFHFLFCVCDSIPKCLAVWNIQSCTHYREKKEEKKTTKTTVF